MLNILAKSLTPYKISKSLQVARISFTSQINQKNEPDFGTDSKTDSDSIAIEFASNIPEAEEALEREENFRKYVETKRDVSRFSKLTAAKKHRQEVPSYSDQESDYLKDFKYFRKVYSRFGKQSGIDPGVSWPDQETLKNIVKEEKEYDLSLEQKIKILIERKNAAKEDYLKMVKDTDEALNKMPKNIEAFYQRIVKKEKSESDRMAKKQEILDQAREFYGYEVDMRDPRIQDMIKKFQEEKKAADKLKKKEDEKKRAQAQALQQKLKEGEQIIKAQKTEAK